MATRTRIPIRIRSPTAATTPRSSARCAMSSPSPCRATSSISRRMSPRSISPRRSRSPTTSPSRARSPDRSARRASSSTAAAASSNFSDFTINAGVTATFDGLIIAERPCDRRRRRRNPGGAGGAAAGGIYDAGVLTLSHSQLFGDTATGGSGGSRAVYGGGGAGGSAAGGIYVTSTGTLNLLSRIRRSATSAIGGQGGQGGACQRLRPVPAPGGAGGAGAVSGQSTTGSPGTAGPGSYGGAGGASRPGRIDPDSWAILPFVGPGGGGGGGTAFADVGGVGTINGTVTDTDLRSPTAATASTVVGSLRYELAIAPAGRHHRFRPPTSPRSISPRRWRSPRMSPSRARSPARSARRA